MVGAKSEIKLASNDTDLILFERISEDIVQLSLNRPDQKNPLDWATVKALRSHVASLENEASVQMVLIRGQGGTFSAGGDLIGYMDLYQNPDNFAIFLDDFYQLFEAMERSSKTFIGIVEGYCVAGGLELLLACDIVIAAHSAKIGDCHLNFGQLPGAGGSQRLPRVIGPMRAHYMMATGALVGAEEAERIGLVSKAVPDEQLTETIDGLVADLCRKSPLGLKGLKYLLKEGLRGDLQSGLQLEIDYVFNYATTADDASEGLVAFQEKRRPQFVGQ